MNPIPPAGAIWSAPLIVDGFLLLLLTMAAAFVIFALMLWTFCSVTRERRRLVCPIQLRPARVLFRLTPTGRLTDVVHCSVFGRRPITCGKVCLPDTGGAA